MAKKQTIANLTRQFKELNERFSAREEERFQINRDLGLSGSADLEETLEKIKKLWVDVHQSELVTAVSKGRSEGIDLATKRENKRLWFLIRSLIGDKTLEKEIEVKTYRADDRFATQDRVVTPFTEEERRY